MLNYGYVKLIHCRVRPLWPSAIQGKYKKSLENIAVLKALVSKEAATYSPALHCSTIGASGLNFSVRNGKRWNPAAITT